MFKKRIREERERLGFSQAQFAAIGHVTTRSQQNYETTDRKPDVAYLSEISKVGADTQYIITGIRSTQALTAEEEQLLIAYRNSSIEVKAFMLQGVSPKQSAARQSIVIKGKVEQQVQAGENAIITHSGRGKKEK